MQGNEMTTVNCRAGDKEFKIYINTNSPYPYRIKREDVKDMLVHDIQEALLNTIDRFESIRFTLPVPVPFTEEEIKKAQEEGKDPKTMEPKKIDAEYTVYNFLLTVMPTFDIDTEGNKIHREDLYLPTYNVAWEEEVRHITTNKDVKIIEDRRKQKPKPQSNIVGADGRPVEQDGPKIVTP